MAVYDILPDKDLKGVDIRDTLNANGSSCTDEFISFFDSRAVINHWSFRKPYATDVDMFKLTDKQIKDINCGFDITGAQIASYTSLADPNVMDGNMNGWRYVRPSEMSKPIYRLGDYVGYFAGAKPMIQDFMVMDKISTQSSGASATAIVNISDGKQVAISDIGDLSDYHAAVFMKKGNTTYQHMFYNKEKTIGEAGTFDVSFTPSELTLGEWTAYPFLLGGSTNSTYFTIPNVSPKNFEVVSSLDSIFVQAQYKYDTSGNIVALQFKFTLTNNSGGSTTNNLVALSYEKDDITVETAKGEWSQSIPNLTVHPTTPYNYPYDYNGMDWAEISIDKFNPSYIKWVVISIGTARIVRSVNILQPVLPK